MIILRILQIEMSVCNIMKNNIFQWIVRFVRIMLGLHTEIAFSFGNPLDEIYKIGLSVAHF